MDGNDADADAEADEGDGCSERKLARVVREIGIGLHLQAYY